MGIVSGRYIEKIHPNFPSLLAVEEGLPILGMAPELVSRQFAMDDLFDKHGGPFVINASFMGGRALVVRSADAIFEAQSKRAQDLTMSMQGVLHNSVTLFLSSPLQASFSAKWRIACRRNSSMVQALHAFSPTTSATCVATKSTGWLP